MIPLGFITGRYCQRMVPPSYHNVPSTSSLSLRVQGFPPDHSQYRSTPWSVFQDGRHSSHWQRLRLGSPLTARLLGNVHTMVYRSSKAVMNFDYLILRNTVTLPDLVRASCLTASKSEIRSVVRNRRYRNRQEDRVNSIFCR